MSFSVTGPFGPHNQHMGAPRGRARHAVTKLRIVAKPALRILGCGGGVGMGSGPAR